MAKNFAEHLALGMMRANITRQDLAKKVGCSNPCLSGYSVGKVVPKDFRLIAAIGQELGLEPGLLEGVAAAELAERRQGYNGRRKPPVAA